MSAPTIDPKTLAMLNGLMADEAFQVALDRFAQDVGDLAQTFLRDQMAHLSKHVRDDEQVDYVIAALAGWIVGSDAESMQDPARRLERLQRRMVASAYVAGWANHAFAAQEKARVH